MRILPMCDKCKALDDKIEQYRRLAAAITDRQMLDGLQKLIAEAEAQKAALHPEQHE
jgi:hypothetical protein